MRKKTASLALALSILGCNASKPGTGESKDPPAKGRSPAEVTVAAGSKTPDSAIIARYCNAPPGPAPESITAMKDSAGNIGGYIFKRLILDSPIHYLDPKGNEVAMFHVFGSPEEKKKNAPIIDALRAAYPVETPLDCPAAP